MSTESTAQESARRRTQRLAMLPWSQGPALARARERNNTAARVALDERKRAARKAGR